jgi:hypothetical protein
MADKKLSFKKHGNNLLVVDNGNTLVVLEDALNAQGEPQVSVSLQAEGEVLARQDHLWDGQDLAKIDVDTSLSHLGASVAEQSTAGFLSSTNNVLLSAASAVAAGGAAGGSGGSAAPTSTTPTASTTPSTTTPSTTSTPLTTDTQTSALTQVFNITGNNQANRLVGNASANVLDGAGGDDILQGAGGDDTLIGGTGQDTAVYKGHAADYAISYDAATDTWQVRDLNAADGDEGTDTLSGVERLQFSNGSLGLVSPVRDAQGNILIGARLVGTTGADVLPTGSGYTAVGGGGDDI